MINTELYTQPYHLQMLKDMENLEDSEKETHHIHGDLINIIN